MKLLGSIVPPDLEETTNSVLAMSSGCLDLEHRGRVGGVQHVQGHAAVH